MIAEARGLDTITLVFLPFQLVEEILKILIGRPAVLALLGIRALPIEALSKLISSSNNSRAHFVKPLNR
jgi:hypothetical protein